MENTQKTSPALAVSLIAPFVIFALFSSFEPTPDAASDAAIPYRMYPMIYVAKILTTSVAILLGFLMYWRHEFPVRVSRWTAWAVLCGILGCALWVGVCHLELEKKVLTACHCNVPAVRSAFNPFEEMDLFPPAYAWIFWAFRMAGLAVIVPIMEEMFLRGFLLRIVEKNDWRSVPVGAASRIVWWTVCFYAIATHPTEAVAAVLWFSGVTAFLSASRNIWDAVALHATTNLLLGLYVLYSGAWWLM